MNAPGFLRNLMRWSSDSGCLDVSQLLKPQFLNGRLAHLELLHLSRNRHRVLGHKFEKARDLKVCNLTFAEGPKFFGAGCLLLP